jgi:hypothetical protein
LNYEALKESYFHSLGKSSNLLRDIKGLDRKYRYVEKSELDALDPSDAKLIFVPFSSLFILVAAAR